MEPITVHVLWDCDSSTWDFHIISDCVSNPCFYDVIQAPRDAVTRWCETVCAFGDVMGEIDDIWNSRYSPR